MKVHRIRKKDFDEEYLYITEKRSSKLGEQYILGNLFFHAVRRDTIREIVILTNDPNTEFSEVQQMSYMDYKYLILNKNVDNVSVITVTEESLKTEKGEYRSELAIKSLNRKKVFYYIDKSEKKEKVKQLYKFVPEIHPFEHIKRLRKNK